MSSPLPLYEQVNLESITLSEKVKIVETLGSFKTHVDSIMDIHPSFSSNISSAISALSVGYKVPGISYFGSAELKTITNDITTIKDNIASLSKMLLGDLTNYGHELMLSFYKLQRLVRDSNADLDKQIEEGTYLYGQKYNFDSFQCVKDARTLMRTLNISQLVAEKFAEE